MDPRTAIVTLLCAALLLIVFLWVRGRLRSLRAWWRMRGARRGELRAERLLTKAGFTVVERQASRVWTIAIDGRALDVSLRADLLVTRRGKRFVADAKTGDVAPSLAHPATRRQLLEYRVAYDVDGALLVDCARGVIHEVVFPGVD